MKIAIVAPSPVPFMIGGAENLWRGLFEYINQETTHQADLIKVPTKEYGSWDLIDSYRAFSLLDLRHFDLVLSTKYPAWMVSHPRHVCYMQHRLRGLADHYQLTGQPATYVSSLPLIIRIQTYMRDRQGSREALPEFFGLLNELRGSPDLPQDALAFPGPFIREIVHFLDGIGLSRANIHRYAAISDHVAKREGYFPKGVPVKVIHHPSSLKAYRTGGSDYLFTASRLDHVKRVALTVEAMQHLPQDVTLKIAGDGPDHGRLMAMAADDPRIKLLGFVPDHQLADLYADALAVLFVPYDEDFGLITIEAMMSGKPVITCTDSGGPNEFVRDGETGFSVQPSPKALAEKIQYLCKHPEDARRMGQAGRARAQAITWEATVSALLDEPVRKPVRVHRARRPKITLATTFAIYPPGYGGPIRIYHLYKNLTRLFDVDLVTISYATDTPFEGEIAPGLREIRVPKSPKHQKRELELEGKVGVPIGDVAMPRLYHLTPEYLAALKRSLTHADLVVASHPYLLPAILEVSDLSHLPLIYEAHNVEVALKQQVLPDNATARTLLDDTRKVEADCCDLSRLIMVCAMSEAKSLSELYGVPLERMIEVPNGVDLETVHFTDTEARKKSKKVVGLNQSFVAIFMGSRHPPNVAAADQLLALAKVLPDVRFLIMGDVCWALRQKALPKNLGLMGVVDEETKRVVQSVADVALNPMTMGSGTNLKMLEYMAAGIPVISTPMGARGLGIDHGEHAVICPIEAFPQEIERLRDDPGRTASQIRSARSLVERSFDWRVIARKLETELHNLLPLPLKGAEAVYPAIPRPAPVPKESKSGLPALHQERLARLDLVWEQIEQIEGWFSKGAAELLMGCHAWQEYHGVSGHLAEIGCYKGKYTACLALCLQEGEAIYIDDIFELQELNISRSGKSCTESDVKWSIKLTGGDVTRLRFLKKKSSELTAADMPGNVRLFHIDGGHSFSEQYEDLEYAAAHITRPYGLLIVDDYENYEWLEVRQATNAFLARHQELVVLAFRDNKAIIGFREVSKEFESEILPLLASQHRRAN